MSSIEKDYAWLRSPTPFTNTSDKWVVIVGVNTSGASSQVDSTRIVYVSDKDGTVLDHFIIGFTTSGETLQGMPRRMLVPPSGTATTNGTGQFSLVRCRTLDLAVAIL